MLVEQPLFIALDGPDCSGKSTVAHLLLSEVTKRTPAHLYSNPGGTPLGSKIRTMVKDATNGLDPLTIFYLFAANHSDLAHVIKKRMEAGTTIIADRWWPSTYAYQGQCGIEPAHIVDVIQQLEQIAPIPRMFYLRCSNDTAKRRMNLVGRVNDAKVDRFEEKGLDFRTKLLTVYDRLSEMGYMYRIDTDDLTLQQVVTIIMEKVYGKAQ
jgi:dTMP kinase